jgi:hypothetical protein
MKRLLYLSIIAALAGLVVFAEIPRSTLFMHVLHKTGHPVAFALMALVVRALLQTNAVFARRAPLIISLIAFLVTVAIGAMTEVLQLFTNRGSSGADVFRDALGALAALSLHAAIAGRFSAVRGKWMQGSALLVGLIATAIAIEPLSWCVAAYANRDLKFPKLLEAQSPLDLYFLSSTRVRLMELPAPWAATSNDKALRSSGTPPAVYLKEPYPDWRQYQVLAVDVTNPNSAAVDLAVRVHDRRHNWQAHDRFNALVTIDAQTRRVVRFTIDSIRTAPSSRTLDMGAIAGISVFAPPGADKFFVSGIWLE